MWRGRVRRRNKLKNSGGHYTVPPVLDYAQADIDMQPPATLSMEGALETIEAHQARLQASSPPPSEFTASRLVEVTVGSGENDIPSGSGNDATRTMSPGDFSPDCRADQAADPENPFQDWRPSSSGDDATVRMDPGQFSLPYPDPPVNIDATFVVPTIDDAERTFVDSFDPDQTHVEPVYKWDGDEEK
ncbi:MAG: hypothetical protein ABII72_04695 [Parcubacteria group bacterium]